MNTKNSVVELASFAASRGWVPATSGNFSARMDKQVFITASGFDKSMLNENNILTLNLDGTVEEEQKPSAETPVHLAIYNLFQSATFVAHTHSYPVTVLSKLTPGHKIRFSNYEILKALPGFETHEQSLEIPIFDNTQNMQELAAQIIAYAQSTSLIALVIRGHGLYVWGKTLEETSRFLEAIEFLFKCELTIRNTQV